MRVTQKCDTASRLHQRHDHEAAAVGEEADLQRQPRERAEASDRGRALREERERPRPRETAAGKLSRPQARRTSTSQEPTVAAATAPRVR